MQKRQQKAGETEPSEDIKYKIPIYDFVYNNNEDEKNIIITNI